MRTYKVRNVALAAVIVTWIPGAQAARWDLDNGWVVNLDSLLSVGVALRTSGTDCKLIGDDNGGCVGTAPTPLTLSDPAKFSASLDLLRLNQDDGNLNYKRWQPVSANTQWVPELVVRANDGWSAMLRGAVNYDAAIAETERTDLEPSAKSFAVTNPRLLDAFITKDMVIGDIPARVRIGNQVISWGEVLFIPGGISAINSFYLPASHSAGTPLKTLYLPAPIVALNTSLTDALSVETFYQWEWNGMVFDAPGTFFSTFDMLGEGGRGIYFSTSTYNAAEATNPGFLLACYGETGPLPPGYIGDTGTHIVGDNPQASGLPGNRPAYNQQLSHEELADPDTNPLGRCTFEPAYDAGTLIARGADLEPEAKQGGAAVRYKFEESGNEVGVYYIRYNDKIPFASYRVVDTTKNLLDLELNFEYGEKRDLYGLSYNFELWDWAIGTEMSYRPRDGVPIDPASVIDGSSPYYCNGLADPVNDTNRKPVGTHCPGYVDTANYQFNVTGLHIVSSSGPMGWLLDLTGASESILIAEAAMGYYPELTFDEGIPWSSTADYTLPTKENVGALIYGSLTWPNIFGTRASLMPDLAVLQGLSGYPATYLPGFIEGAGLGTLGFNIDFKTKPVITMRIDATQYWGGGSANIYSDRDFMSVSVTTAF